MKKQGWKGEGQRHSVARKGVRTRKDVDPTTTDRHLKNLKMNDDVYKLRREAMKYIYEAKQLCELPRITIRITEKNQNILGKALIEDNTIWIPENSIKEGYDMRSIVYHELLHAVFGVPHADKDDLMSPYHKKLTKEKADKLFIKWAKKYGGNCYE